MIDSRTVAILTLDDCMRRVHYTCKLIGMAVFAVILSLVFDLNFFPVLYVPFSVPAIHITPFMNAKIMRDIEESYNQEQYDNPDYYKKRPPDMASHSITSSVKSGSKKGDTFLLLFL